MCRAGKVKKITSSFNIEKKDKNKKKKGRAKLRGKYQKKKLMINPKMKKNIKQLLVNCNLL